MVSLVDIVPQTRTVQIAAGELELRGLGLRQIADLFLLFPNLRNLFVEGAPEITATELILGAPDAIGMIISLAAGQPEAANKIVDVGSGVAPDECFICLEAIFDLTFPRGVAPFLQKALPLLALFARSDDAGPSGRDLDMSVPQGPSNSSLQDTTLVQ
jgi:hypothetical protein